VEEKEEMKSTHENDTWKSNPLTFATHFAWLPMTNTLFTNSSWHDVTQADDVAIEVKSSGLTINLFGC